MNEDVLALLNDPTFRPDLRPDTFDPAADIAIASPLTLIAAPETAPEHKRRIKPQRRKELRCKNPTPQRSQYSDACRGWSTVPCGEMTVCDECGRWRIEERAARYSLVGWPYERSVVWVSGFEDHQRARQWRTAQGRRLAGQRVNIIRRNEQYTWDCITIYTEEIGMGMLRTIRRAAIRNGVMADIEYRGVSEAEFMALVPRYPKVDDVRTLNFVDWPDWDEEPDDFACEVQYTGDAPTGTVFQEPGEISPEYRRISKIDNVEERAYQHALNWAAQEYVPAALEREVRQWAAGERAWREAYRPVLPLLGIEKETPPAHCRGCKAERELTLSRYCAVCVTG